MRAFLLSGYGAISDHVQLAQIADPAAGPGEVLLEIHAASLNQRSSAMACTCRP